MSFSAKLASALRMVLDEPIAAFEALQRLRKEAIDQGATGSAAAASRSLVLAAKLTGDAEAEVRFAKQWHDHEGSESSGRLLASLTARTPDSSLDERAIDDRDDLQLRLVLLVERIVVAGLDRRIALQELKAVREEALRNRRYAIAARCLDEMILAARDLGEGATAWELAHDLVIEMPSARAFNMLGRAAAAVGEIGEARRAFELALSNANTEGDFDEASQASESIAGLPNADEESGQR